jgi:thiol-disulfide isomerase/thioredoxin
MANQVDYGIVGYMAPEWGVEKWIDKNGKPTEIDMQDYDHSVKVLYCFQSWCKGCHQIGFPALKQMVDALKDNDRIAFFAVQTVFEGKEENTFEKIKEIQKKYNLEIPFGHDAGDESTENISKIMHNYRSGGTPWFIVIGIGGSVVYNDFQINTEKAIAVLKKLADE